MLKNLQVNYATATAADTATVQGVTPLPVIKNDPLPPDRKAGRFNVTDIISRSVGAKKGWQWYHWVILAVVLAVVAYGGYYLYKKFK